MGELFDYVNTDFTEGLEALDVCLTRTPIENAAADGAYFELVARSATLERATFDLATDGEDAEMMESPAAVFDVTVMGCPSFGRDGIVTIGIGVQPEEPLYN